MAEIEKAKPLVKIKVVTRNEYQNVYVEKAINKEDIEPSLPSIEVQRSSVPLENIEE